MDTKMNVTYSLFASEVQYKNNSLHEDYSIYTESQYNNVHQSYISHRNRCSAKGCFTKLFCLKRNIVINTTTRSL